MLVSGNEKMIVMIYYDITKLYMNRRKRCRRKMANYANRANRRGLERFTSTFIS